LADGSAGNRQRAHFLPKQERAAGPVIVEARPHRGFIEKCDHLNCIVALPGAVGQKQHGHAVVDVARRPVGQAIGRVAFRPPRLHGLEARKRKRGQIDHFRGRLRARLCVRS
jgi:hypothetical protein